MENNKSHIAFLEELTERIDDSSVSLLDFDEIRKRLVELKDVLTEHHDLTGQLATLRKDYEQRVAGMVKAIAAVDRKRDTWQEALALVEQLPSLTAELLLEQHRRISARFRDTFPASAHLPGLRSYSPSGRRAATIRSREQRGVQ
ncbi:MAG: hypothetical protein DRP45_02080 [Candidatus Zixiibacteriota bacterium]|nr:MAG: hypothetical protein DRP45_02080 [candidate division Zixibacteria bacterium]